jgi:hypothetical protein
MSQNLLPPLMAYWMLADDIEYLYNGHWVRQFRMYPLWLKCNNPAYAIIWVHHRVSGRVGSSFSGFPILALVRASSPLSIRFFS